MPNKNAEIGTDETTTDEVAEKTTEKTFTQEEVNRLMGELRAKERSKFADYDALKEKASKWDETEEKNKTELEKLTERAAKAEAEAAKYRHDSEIAGWKAQVSASTGVAAGILRGETLEEIQAHAEAIKAAMPSYRPVDPGKPADGRMTFGDVEAIKDPIERIRKRAELLSSMN